MWNGYLDFFVKASTGDPSVWWEAHNEHRILLARIFFWIDLSWFNGSAWLLIALNYILAFTSVFVFYKFLKNTDISNKKNITIISSLFLSAWLLSWSQQENLNWGFQSQFFLAQLIPLTSFYLLYKASDYKNKMSIYWISACFFGVLSIGTMANGVLTLPLMVLYALLLKQSRARIATLAILAAVTITLYFYDYTPPPHHGSLVKTLTTDPLGVVKYILLYIGGPFYYLFNQTKTGIIAAQLAGAFLILASSIFTVKSLNSRENSPLRLALLFFIIYIGGTALGTAGGRLFLGLEQALSSRYMTPALMAWAALFIVSLTFYYAPEKKRENLNSLKFLLLLSIIFMFPHQLSALTSKRTELFDKKISALALELRIKDQEQITKVFPNTDVVLKITAIPVNLHLSIFGADDIVDIKELMGTHAGMLPSNQCQGSLDDVSLVDEDDRYVRVQGWIFDPIKKNVPSSVKIINSLGAVNGYALSGLPRPDVAHAVEKNAIYSGFKGYLLKDELGKQLTFMGSDSSCSFSTSAPNIFYKKTTATPSAKTSSVSTKNIIGVNGWKGKDSWQSNLPEMQVIGSWVNSDADTGSISLKLKKGDRLFYRSGPSGGRQLLNINGITQNPLILPITEEWAFIDFSGKLLPDEFEVTISDLGDRWGEWSAIAINANK